jgi:hypothetical protein
MQKALRQAELYGRLITRGDRLYNLGGNPLDMARSRWLMFKGNHQTMTEGRQRAKEISKRWCRERRDVRADLW